MTEHTPGPWLYRPREHDDWGWVRTSHPDPDGFTPLVAQARSGKLDKEEELDEHRRNGTDPFGANARLIAAAPEMLDALREIAWSNDSKWQADRARVAIAKATGVQGNDK